MINSPTGLDKDGYLYVTSASNHTFTKYSRDGVLIKEVGGQDLDLGEIVHPCGVSVISEFKSLGKMAAHSSVRLEDRGVN